MAFAKRTSRPSDACRSRRERRLGARRPRCPHHRRIPQGMPPGGQLFDAGRACRNSSPSSSLVLDPRSNRQPCLTSAPTTRSPSKLWSGVTTLTHDLFRGRFRCWQSSKNFSPSRRRCASSLTPLRPQLRQPVKMIAELLRLPAVQAPHLRPPHSGQRMFRNAHPHANSSDISLRHEYVPTPSGFQ